MAASYRVLAFLLATFLCLYPCLSKKSKPITASLETKWPQPPIILEASEFLADRSNDKFWGFFDQLISMGSSQAGLGHDESSYKYVLKFGAQLLTNIEMDLLKLSLSVHSHAPRIELFNQIANDLPPPEGCDAFIDVHGQMTCSLDDLNDLITSATKRPKPNIYKVDHKHPSSSDSASTVVILYGQMDKGDASKVAVFHRALKGIVQTGRIQYIFRHYVTEKKSVKVRLSGYGVELAIKSTEYKAVDDSEVKDDKVGHEDIDDGPDEVEGFVFTKLKELHPNLTNELHQFRQSLLDTTSIMDPLKVWQLQDISFQAAQRVLLSPASDGLRILRDICQNFPLLARSLVKTQVKSEIKSEIGQNKQIFASTFGVDGGDSMVMINGLVIDTDVADPFMLLDLFLSEGKMMEGLHSLGLQGSTLSTVMKTKVEKSDGEYAVDLRDHAVLYVNDLESDKKYKRWPGSIHEMLRPVFPGMMRYVKKNMFHMVSMIDPTHPDSSVIFGQTLMLYESDYPIRFGFVFVVDDTDDISWKDDAGVAMARTFNFLLQEEGVKKALEFVIKIYDESDEETVTPSLVRETFEDVAPGEDMDDIAGIDSAYDDRRKAGKAFYRRTALKGLPQVLMNGIPLSKDELNLGSFEDEVITSIMQQTPDIQKDVYRGKMRDSTDILDYLMDRPNVMPRLNPRILTSDPLTFIDLSGNTDSVDTANPDHLTDLQLTASVAESLKYLTKKDDSAIRPVSIWVATDLETSDGRQLLLEAIKHVKSSNNARVGYIHSTSDPTKPLHWLPKAVQAALRTQTRNLAKNFIVKLLKEENFESISKGKKTIAEFEVNGMDMAAFQASLDSLDPGMIHLHHPFCNKVLHSSKGQRVIVVNGRVFGPLDDGEEFTGDDFSLVEKLILSNSAEAVKTVLQKNSLGLDLKGEAGSTFLMKVDSFLAASSRDEVRRDTHSLKTEASVVKIAPAEPDQPSFDVVVILDPLSRDAQKWSHVLMVLNSALNINLQVFMNPREQLSEMPLKSFYRYVLEPEITFRVDSSLASGPIGRFNDMPEDTLLTLNLLTPESWLVESVRTRNDLDNIKLSEVDGAIVGQFELENLLLEGHCFEQASGQPPRGLQFTLGTKSKPEQVDTIVMANLGYFQLKANPGAWMLKLRQGRSSDVYEISSSSLQGTDSPPESEDAIVIMDSFKSKIIRIKVNKQSGKESESLLSEETDTEHVEGGIWDSLQSSFKSFTGSAAGGGTKTKENGTETLNIFSLASGHLYERLLRIMMLSVLKNTQSKVKFWFLKNYLSPTFKEFIPHMAEEYNFEFELVQYKWPRWLNQQTEKQRIIWGYKILFLDVLFPLNVKKIIYVDADQIVQADMQELADFDLKGAPYGYTPFCDSRKEMDGFRFWKSGYWANHLAGRKYHISALYVVDLVKFRKIAAGDRLRGQYQSLSQDPNSLSNLDQDLPNNMIHQVAIRSLPQEWLWCETWCSNAEKARAKTIDLCNNPLTKEPKLQAAVRIVPEWVNYDNEIKRMQERLSTPTMKESPQQSKDVHNEL